MTPKEKAKELVIKFVRTYSPDKGEVFVEDHFIWTSKNQFHIGHFANCALIVVDEIIEELIVTDYAERFNYWQEVKQEIEKL